MRSHLILPDPHCPAYNKAFIEAVLKYIYLNRDTLTGIVWLGDLMDIQSINSYAVGSLTEITLGQEYEATNIFLDLFDEALGDRKEKVIMYGNHEDRLRKSLSLLAMSKLGSAIQSIESGLNLNGRGYRIFDDYQNDIYKLDDLSLFHGVYYNIHCAKKNSEVFKCNTMSGHTHRAQSFDEGPYASSSIGWMGDKNHRFFNYAPMSMKSYWVNAFAKVDSYMGITSPQTIKWKNENHFICDGKIYK